MKRFCLCVLALAGAAFGQMGVPGAGPKQIDIGAAEAPLSDGERVALDAAVRRHKYAEEKAVIDKALGEHPESFELLVMWGRIAYLEQQPKDAAAALLRADKVKAVSEADRATLAVALEFSGKAAESRAELVKLTKLAPKNAEYFRLLGRMDERERKPDLAEKEYAEALKLEPQSAQTYHYLANAQEQLGEMDKARATLTEGARVNRAQPVHWEWSPLDLAMRLLKDNEVPEAEKLVLEALSYKPHFALGHYYLGLIRQKQGQDAEATAEYREAVVTDPKLRQAWLALGREFTRQGKTAEAEKALAIFKKLDDEEKVRLGEKK